MVHIRHYTPAQNSFRRRVMDTRCKTRAQPRRYLTKFLRPKFDIKAAVFDRQYRNTVGSKISDPPKPDA
jgi:hypothetical protein